MAEGPACLLLAHVTERVLIPLTGIAVLLGHDDLPWLHVTFFRALAEHVGQVLEHTLVDRDGLLGRML
ncbi:hypothetical protein [Nocardioides sp. InS609-2]|uniref:hypothetical protein n=1 Tax=Nocardioides sp. InS609-2 TaxID=2760705 RepID=UPI0020BDD635|nr:hypothetical protein [Nocardioides sp. InS609-2]